MKTYAQRLIELKQNFVPQNRHFTSESEARYIKDTLELESLNDFELQNMRDMAVMFFSDTASSARLNEDYDEYDDAWTVMMSVTAVIDNIKWSRGLAV